MKKIILVIVAVILLFIICILGFLVYKNISREEPEEEEIIYSQEVTLDTEKESTHLSKVINTEGVYWQRMFDLYWNEVEREKGQLDWEFVDEKMQEISEMEVYPLVMIKPFANWDQDECHGEEYVAEFDPQKGGKVKVGKPCDMDAFAAFLEKAVERYDGDGQNDMPGLEIPIKYWEVMNEPSMQGGVTGGMGEELKFFVGTPDEYFDILKTSYEVIKRVDPEANVVQGGMAGMHDNFVDFWEPILKKGGGNYFDIANMHSISTDERREDLFIIRFNRLLKKYELEDKPIWITELQLGDLTEKPNPDDLGKFEILMVKSSVFSLSLGADKLFYIENWVHWDEDNGWGKKPNIEELKDTTTHKVYLNLVDKINKFEKIDTIKEDYIENPSNYDGTTSMIGQYKFIYKGSEIYILWGEADLPSEISGQIRVTDIYGDSYTTDAEKLELTDKPVFVEEIKE